MQTKQYVEWGKQETWCELGLHSRGANCRSKTAIQLLLYTLRSVLSRESEKYEQILRLEVFKTLLSKVRGRGSGS